MKLIRTALILTLVCTTTLLSAQRRRSYGPPTPPKLEDLPKRPVDTIDTADPETKVIIFSNNTWEFYVPNLVKRLSHLPVYQNNWDTTSIFSYRNLELKDLPQNLDIKLIDSMAQFYIPIIGSVFSKYGPRGRRRHNGVDIPLKTGEPIHTAFEGKIRYAKYNPGGFGNLVIVRHPNGLETWYAHLSKLNVQVNDYVKVGQVIGFGGSTGRSRGPHLHMEVRYCDQTFDPEHLFDYQSGGLRYQTFALEKSMFNIHSRASETLDEEDDDPNFAATLLAAADDSTIIRAAQPKPVAADPGSPVYHTIRQGDMLGKLAMRYGTTVNKICQLNKITPTTTLALGRRLRIK